jgi:phytoene/squalene synthetase
MGNHALILTSLAEMYAMNRRLDDVAVQAEQGPRDGHEAYALRLVGEIAARRESSPLEGAMDAYHRAIALAEAPSSPTAT